MIKISTIFILILGVCVHYTLYSISCNVIIILIDFFSLLFHFFRYRQVGMCVLWPNSGSFGFENLFYILFALNDSSCMHDHYLYGMLLMQQNFTEMPTPKQMQIIYTYQHYVYFLHYVAKQAFYIYYIWLSFAQYFHFYRL